MFFKNPPSFKHKAHNILLPLIILYCFPTFALFENSCFKENKYFISRYFSARAHPRELEKFFDCIDNNIQLILNHTRTGNPNYYTQTEIRRLAQYMGATKKKATAISQAILNIKTGFIGGSNQRFTLKEIAVLRYILSIIRQRMRSMYHFTIPTLIYKVLTKQNITRKKLIRTTETIQTNLIYLGKQLSKVSLASDLSLLRQFPGNVSTLGFANTNLKYWAPALSLLGQWKNIFFDSPEHIIHSHEWPLLLDSLGQLITLWLYQKRFMEGRNWLNANVIQHTQHFLSHSLNLIRDTQKQSGNKHISLNDIDELARKAWFLPHISSSTFRLGLRSTFCFLLNPLTTNKTCAHNMNFNKSNLQISFSDLRFTIKNTKEIYESRSGKNSDQITKSHLNILRQYLNFWIRTENQMRKTPRLPLLFGSPHKWIKRRISVTPDNRLLFYTNRTDNIPLLSQLNWQSQLMRIVTSSYTKRGSRVNQKLWNTMIKEWTAFSVSLYTDIDWPSFQQLGFQVFKHGDFLTSQSNGDQILQQEEILELFSIFTSSLSTALYATKIIQHCQSVKPYHFRTPCAWDYLLYLPIKLFEGFPHLLSLLSKSKEKNINYNNKLRSFYKTNKELSLKDLFEVFLFMHYQENTMEYLDKDSSQYLSTRELEPLLNTFEETVINTVPIIYTKKEAFAFMTYFFHYGEVPVFSENKKISSPLRFSQWLLQPGKWQLQVNREDILTTLFLMNRNLSSW